MPYCWFWVKTRGLLMLRVARMLQPTTTNKEHSYLGPAATETLLQSLQKGTQLCWLHDYTQWDSCWTSVPQNCIIINLHPFKPLNSWQSVKAARDNLYNGFLNLCCSICICASHIFNFLKITFWQLWCLLECPCLLWNWLKCASELWIEKYYLSPPFSGLEMNDFSLWWPKWQGNPKERRYMYMYSWFILLYNRN